MKNKVISSSSEIMGGTPVFSGTRVPVQTLLDYLTAGDSIDDFLKGFPTVEKSQILGFLKQALNLYRSKSALKIEIAS